uniref:BY PROTMAP: gi/647401743/emb/CDR48098.1/ RHTO0S16e01200g1_1 [Rhodosporidium toruloides] n=1 Tax=Rhodotorula toruloides TaxID=5286 RepID=A0A0K3C9C4_RHOTO
MSSPSLHSSDKEKGQEIHNEYVGKALDAPYLSPAEEKKLMRKIDYKLVPFLSLLYLLSFLDRVNIGQARLDGLEKDLHLKGNQYQIALVVFFVGYVSTEIPGNILLKKMRPSRFIPAIMISWGIVMTLMGTCSNFAGLVAARFFLGLTESVLFPGICFYLVSWYKRNESNLRIAIFFSSATLSGAFGGLLAYGLSKMAGIEGLLTFVVGCISPWMIEDFPEEAQFLTPAEREHVVRRLKEDTGAAGTFKMKYVMDAFKDWKTYVFALIYIGVAEPLYALSLFSPTIISELGTFSRAQSQLLSTPPYALAFFITLATAIYSDRIQRRGIFNIFWMTVVIIGYGILIGIETQKHPGVAYFAVFLCVCGVAPCIANTIVWTGNNFSGVLKRGTSMGVMFAVGNSGGIVSSLVYRTQDKPRYILGHAVGLGFAGMCVLLSIFMMVYFQRENARRDAKYGKVPDFVLGANGEELTSVADDPEIRRRFGLDGMTEEQIEGLGDKNPLFRYYQ